MTEVWQIAHHQTPGLGISRLPDGTTLDDLLRSAPVALVGRVAASTGLLVKLLDSGERLPVHCHPSREFASRVLGSRYGKAEAWVVLDAKPNAKGEPPKIWLGWREGVSEAELATWILRQDAAMLEAMSSTEVRTGDVWYVPPGVPHSIGAGIFLVELQEPTDYSIVAEWSGFPIDPSDAHLRVGWDVMLEAFDRRPMTDTRFRGLRQSPAVTQHFGDLHQTELIGPQGSRFFRADRLAVMGEAPWPYRDAFAIGIVVAGSGSARGRDSDIALARGVTFAVPAAAASHTVILSDDALDIISCTPGDPP